MIKIAKQSILMFLVLTILTGIAYPLAVTAVAQLFWPGTANGGLLFKDGKPVGADLLGQEFNTPDYFWGRLSATSPPYNAAASSGSNLGPLNPELLKRAEGRLNALAQAGSSKRPVPIDLVTSSSSGLDPEISPEAAEYQVPRISTARAIPEAKLNELIRSFTEERTLGIIGERRVNVLKLNLALDKVMPTPERSHKDIPAQSDNKAPAQSDTEAPK